MSGGSWNYLCLEDAVGLLNRTNDLDRMKERLRSDGFQLAGGHIVSLQERLGQLDVLVSNIESGIQGLLEVFKAVEWHDSGDYSREYMVEKIAAYEKAWSG